MTKKEFLSDLSKELEDLSKEERESALKYYEDYFDDAGSENESDVIKELESPQKVAEVIKKDNNKNNSSRKKESHSHREPLPVWAIVLLALFFVPIGIPLIVAFFSTVFGLFMGLLGIIIGLTAAGVAILASGIGTSVFGIVQLFINPVNGLLIIGVGSILTGIGLLFTLLMIKLITIVIPPLIRGIVDLIRYPFRNRGE